MDTKNDLRPKLGHLKGSIGYLSVLYSWTILFQMLCINREISRAFYGLENKLYNLQPTGANDLPGYAKKRIYIYMQEQVDELLKSLKYLLYY